MAKLSVTLNKVRKRIFEIIEQSKDGDKTSLVYDLAMLIIIIVSIVPLMFVRDYPIFHTLEVVTITIFIIDYLLRWMTADFKLGRRGWSFLIYPFTGWAIIDLLSILPGLSIMGQGFKIFRVTRMLRILRLFKLVRYSEKIQVFGKVLYKERSVLLGVLGISVFYVFLTALIMFNAEPHWDPVDGKATFDSFFDALYWATVTLTTVGYGDLTPVTDLGRFVSMLSSLFGVAIIALPSGVITASYLDELRAMKKKNGEQADDDETE